VVVVRSPDARADRLTIGKTVCHVCRKEPELTWIAKQAVQVPLPPHWQEHEDDSGNPYFYDTNTGKKH
jgi:hypothetical protein